MCAFFNKVSEAIIADVKAGTGTGSVFVLHIRADNDAMLYFMVKCSWKLVFNNTITCTWNDPELYIQESLQRLIGKKSLNIILSIRGDLSIIFEDDFELIIFNDSSYLEDVNLYFDYFLQSNNKIYFCVRDKFYMDGIN